MRIRTIPPETRVRTSSLPLLLPATGPSAVLLIHGFTGHPGDMAYLGRRLQASGFTVSVPRLPGHGTNAADFLQTGWRDWLRASVDAYLTLRSRHDRVHIAGLSMGGLLTIVLASQFHPERIALAAPALVIANRSIGFAPLLAPFLARLPAKSTGGEGSGDPDLDALQEEYWRWDWVRPAAQLLSLKALARRLLPSVRSRTLTIVSKADRTVRLDSAELIERRIGASVRKTVVLERSPHVVVNDIEKEVVAEEIVRWFSD